MPLPTAYFWNKVPFIRLLVALVAGILLQWHFQFPFSLLLAGLFSSLLLFTIYSFLSVKTKYRFSYINGISINFINCFS
jgi:competence protein ComEC